MRATGRWLLSLGLLCIFSLGLFELQVATSSADQDRPDFVRTHIHQRAAVPTVNIATDDRMDQPKFDKDSEPSVAFRVDNKVAAASSSTSTTTTTTTTSTPVAVPDDAPSATPTVEADQKKMVETPSKPPVATATPVPAPAVSKKVHAFYYSWYGNPNINGKWLHWNHEVLKKWDDHSTTPPYVHRPPDDIGSTFYPTLGPYSSLDEQVIDQHMQWLVRAKVGVLCLSWWGKDSGDEQLSGDRGYSDRTVFPIMEAAAKYGLQVSFHLEPYKGRNADSTVRDVKYIIDTYGHLPAMYRDVQTKRPLFFVYDSYLIDVQEWARVLKKDAPLRTSTKYNSIFLGLLVEEHHKSFIVSGGFDGAYTYFAANGFVWGSSWRNWDSIQRFCGENNLLFFPSAGPGYDDARVRPWNGANTHSRQRGEYYRQSLQHAVDLSPSGLTITSFNEWHEGTQIEPAVPKTIRFPKPHTYKDYGPASSKEENQYLYLDISAETIQQWEKF